MLSTAFVTGGGGYVGSRLCKELLESGYTRVIAFDIHFIDKEQEDKLEKIEVGHGLHWS